jgi:hypothetical protein
MRRTRVAVATVIATVGCDAVPPPLAAADATAVQRAALTTLFLEREHAMRLVLWRGPLADAPALGVLPGADTLRVADADPRGLALPVPVDTANLGTVTAHFREHPDAWRAWFTRHAGSPGLIELTAPYAVDADGTSAALLVGRSCGEHCRMAWRVRVRRRPDGAWRTDSVISLRLPPS